MILESEIRNAMRNTTSNAEASRYLNVCRHTYKKYAELYKTDDGTMSLYDAHSNKASKGIRKRRLNYAGTRRSVEDILNGKYPDYSLVSLRNLLIREGILQEKCELCGFEERRLTDFQMPLLLTFKDGDNKNWNLDNMQLLCYNCYYLTCGNIMGRKARHSKTY